MPPTNIPEPARKGAALTPYEQAVNFIRSHGPMTAARLADRLQWPLPRVAYAITRGRELSLLARTGKTHTGKFIYGAVQVPGWPLPAPDTVRS